MLVHCRGGVGRAGVVACCWIMKLGVCGWLRPTPMDGVDQPALAYVEKVVSFVRRRRSPKAIETFEQVKFLLEYVQFLQTRTSVVALA